MKKWYVLYVNVRHEKKVFDRLHELNVETYLPLVKTQKQWSDRVKTIEQPLFTGYVFVKLEEVELEKPLFVKGVLNYLKFSKKHAIVKDDEIEGLKFLVSHGYELQEDSDEIKVGSKVKLLLSQFKEISATIHEIKESYVFVTFEGLNQNFKLKTPKGAIKIV